MDTAIVVQRLRLLFLKSALHVPVTFLCVCVVRTVIGQRDNYWENKVSLI